VTEPSKTPYLHVREAEAVLFPFAVEIVGNAKALLRLRKQIDRVLKDVTTYPFDETLTGSWTGTSSRSSSSSPGARRR
jgi:hypothetical protein